MNLRTLSALTFATAVALVGCDRKTFVVQLDPLTPLPEPIAKTKTLETSRLGTTVDAYLRAPDAENHAAVKRALADLDGEIAELEALVAKRSGGPREEAAVKLRNLQAYRTAEMARFMAGQAVAPLAAPAPTDARTGAEKVEDAAQRTGKSIENAARKTGDAIKDVVR